MPKRPDFILQISIRNIEDFSPAAIVKSPRTFRPMDVQNACKNIALVPTKDTPSIVTAFAHYIMLDFFAHAHATGLYNRQIKLWESLTRTISIEVEQATKGLFGQEKLPEYDFVLYDQKRRPIVFAHMAMPAASGDNFDYLKSAKEFLRRTSQMQGLVGLFVCFPSPFPTKVLESIRKEINATDSVARFEAVLPKLGIPLNLVEIERSPVYNPSTKTDMQKLRLVHPDLSKKKLGSAMPGADLNSIDDSDEGFVDI
jgi:hypothetical protein